MPELGLPNKDGIYNWSAILPFTYEEYCKNKKLYDECPNYVIAQYIKRQLKFSAYFLCVLVFLISIILCYAKVKNIPIISILYAKQVHKNYDRHGNKAKNYRNINNEMPDKNIKYFINSTQRSLARQRPAQ